VSSPFDYGQKSMRIPSLNTAKILAGGASAGFAAGG
jgi:hypothetical protein